MIEKILDFISEEKIRLEKNIIYRIGQTYHVFGQYRLEMLGYNDIMVYKRQESVGEFVDTKSALAWCIADKFNQIELAQSIANFSFDQRRLIDDIEITKQFLRKNQTSQHRDLLNNKFDFKLARLKSTRYQLKKMIDQAKYLQKKGFDHETH